MPTTFHFRWLPTVATIAAIGVFVAAGNWQRGRMDEKAGLRARFDAAMSAPAVALPAADDWNAWRYRNVVVSGTYDAARQFLLDNKVQAGRAGYHVIAPLELRDGRTVLVDRGFVAAMATRAEHPVVPAPAGPVEVRGHVNLPPAFVELGNAAPVDGVWQNLDPRRYAQVTGKAVLPIVIEQDAPGAPADGLVRDWTAPDFGIEKHRIYMVQWYSFAALAAGLWLWFHRGRGLRREPGATEAVDDARR
jgi:surfeit locus 1 family protein